MVFGIISFLDGESPQSVVPKNLLDDLLLLLDFFPSAFYFS